MSTTTAPVSLASHLLTMPMWQKVLLTLAGVAAAGGLSGQAIGYFAHKPEPAARASVQPEGARGVVAQQDQSTQQQPEEDKPFYLKLSPHATRMGLTFIAAFLIGWAFRAFLKMMAMITVVIGGLFFGLSYFKVMNVDFSKVEKPYNTSKEWVTDQAWKLKDVLVSHLPSSTASVVGLFAGFRRKS